MSAQTFWHIINQLSFDIPAFLAVIIFHEYCHVIAARRLIGNDEAQSGFKPLSHLDLFGTLLPACLVISGFPIVFGWGKRVEVEFAPASRGSCTAVFAVAGIIGNLSLCLLTGLIISAIPASDFLFSLTSQPAGVFFYTLLFRIFSISLAVMLVNLLPIPPFDGGYLFFSLLPDKLKKWQEKLQLLALLIVVTLVLTGIAGAIFVWPFKMLTDLLCGGFSAYVLQPGTLATDFLSR